MDLHFYDQAVRAYALSPGDSEIYITAENGEEVHRIPREHGAAAPTSTSSEPLFDGYSQVMSMDSNDTHVAWTDGVGSTLYILDKSTDELTAIPRAEPFDFPSDAHFVGDVLYFLDGNDSVNGDQAMMMAVDGQPKPVGREGTYYGIASDGDTVYTVGHGGVYQPGREVYESKDAQKLDITLEVEEVDFLLGATRESWLASASNGYMYYLGTVTGEDCHVDRVRL